MFWKIFKYRPTVGEVMLNIYTFPTHDLKDDILTIMHEIGHILGFSKALYPYFLNPKTGERYSEYLI